MTEQDDHVMHESTREKIKEMTQSGVMQLFWPGIMTIALFFLGYAVNRLSDHFDRIDAHLASSDTANAVDHKDLADLKALVVVHEAQIKEIQGVAQKTAWTVDEMQRERVRR